MPEIRVLSTSVTTQKVGGTLVLHCSLVPGAVTPVGFFRWNHRSQTGTIAYEMDMSPDPRVTVYIDHDFQGRPTSSTLVIGNVTTKDSGVLSCEYFYLDGPAVSYDASVCVSDAPVRPPECSSSIQDDVITLTCLSWDICPNDIVLEWRTTTSGMHGIRDSNSTHVRNQVTIQIGEFDTNGYTCTMTSQLFPENILTCSIDSFQEGTHSTVLPEISTATDSVSTRSLMTSARSLQRQFSQYQLIIAACVPVAGILFLLICICIILVCCKTYRKKSADKPNHEIVMDNFAYSGSRIVDQTLTGSPQTGKQGTYFTLLSSLWTSG